MIKLRNTEVYRFTWEDIERIKAQYKRDLPWWVSPFKTYLSEAFPGKYCNLVFDENSEYYYVFVSDGSDVNITVREQIDEDGKPYRKEFRFT